jgi:hypothetical protein
MRRSLKPPTCRWSSTPVKSQRHPASAPRKVMPPCSVVVTRDCASGAASVR